MKVRPLAHQNGQAALLGAARRGRDCGPERRRHEPGDAHCATLVLTRATTMPLPADGAQRGRRQ